MKDLRVFLTLIAVTALVLFVTGCSSDDKGTNDDGSEAMLSDSATVEQILFSLEGETGALGLVMASVSSALGDFDGYEEPNIDDLTGGGFGKVTGADTDSFYYSDGWHIFIADESVIDQQGDTTYSWDIELGDSVYLSKDGTPQFMLDDPDYLDRRSHIDLFFGLDAPDIDMDMDLVLYSKIVLDLQANNDLWVDLDQLFDVSLSGEGMPGENPQGPSESIEVRYVYSIDVDDMVFIESDYYSCATAGSLDMNVDVYVTDGTNTLTGSAVVQVVVTGHGTLTGTVTSGTWEVEFTDDGFCAYPARFEDSPVLNLIAR